MTHEELELTDIRDFTTVLRDFEMQEWLQWPIESDLGMRFAIWSLDLAFATLLSSNTVSNVSTGH